MSGELEQGAMCKVHSNWNVMCKVHTVWKMADYKQSERNEQTKENIMTKDKLSNFAWMCWLHNQNILHYTHYTDNSIV